MMGLEATDIKPAVESIDGSPKQKRFHLLEATGYTALVPDVSSASYERPSIPARKLNSA
jgi:hypothetical protein